MKNARALYYNGKIVTVDSKDTIAGAFVVKDGKFEAVGSSRDLLRAFDSAEKIDLHGACVIPGLNDGHAHPFMAGLENLTEEIPAFSSADDILDWIRLETRKKRPDQWIYVHRCFPSRLSGGRWPALEDLDRAAPGHPVFLNGAWAGVANTCALKRNNIGPGTRHEGVVRGPDGKLNGVLHRSA
ncbi:MAG: hypothetical protein EHM21_18250, partial [Chloroflexi bacterium]